MNSERVNEIIDKNKSIEKALKTIEKPLKNTVPEKIKFHEDKYNYKYNSKYHPTLLKCLYQLGRVDREVCEELHITEKTLHAWKREHKEVKKAIKQGKSSIDQMVENSLLRRALGYNYYEEQVIFNEKTGKVTTKKIRKHLPGDTSAAIFWLKNRRGDRWRERIENTIQFEESRQIIAGIFSKKDKKLPFDEEDNNTEN